ncbi:MAG: DMT family transporter [Halolamina sp.]
MDSQTKGTLLMVVSATGFGTIAVLGKLAAQVGMSIPTMLAWRFLFGGLIIWVVLGARGDLELLRGRDLAAAVAIGGGWYAVASGFYFWGLEFMTAGLVAIVIYTYPAFVLLLSLLFLEEVITRRTVGALALAFAGVGLVTGVRPAGASVVGVVVVLGAALTYAAYYVTGHVALEDVGSATLAAHVVPAAATSFLLFGLATGRLAVPATTYEWSLVAAFATIGCAIPLTAFFAGLSHIGASRASIISSLEPVTAVLLGAAVLGEPVTVPTAVGGALILAGVVLLQLE